MGRVKQKAPTKAITLLVSRTLADRITNHILHEDTNQTDFVTRALVNQLESEGDFEIRGLLEEESEEEE